MIFVTQPVIGQMVLMELRDAVEVRLAVAFFNPDANVLSALCGVQRLSLIISEEFTINNPYKLGKVSETAVAVLSVPPDSENGKLHSKVLIVTRNDGSTWVLVGSANMTWQGLFSNQEACLALDSGNEEDLASISQITEWFVSLLVTARTPDLEEAKQVFNSRSNYRLERRPLIPQDKIEINRYWALKAMSGFSGEDFWHRFVTESIVAIGWEGINVDPSEVSLQQLENAIRNTYPVIPNVRTRRQEKDPHGAAIKLKKFVEINIGDIVLICRGYPGNSTKPVHIRGFARITGPFRVDHSSSWKWRFKRDAVIQIVDLSLPKNEVAEALDMGSLRQTIHELSQSSIERLAEKLGVRLEV